MCQVKVKILGRRSVHAINGDAKAAIAVTHFDAAKLRLRAQKQLAGSAAQD